MHTAHVVLYIYINTQRHPFRLTFGIPAADLLVLWHRSKMALHVVHHFGRTTIVKGTLLEYQRFFSNTDRTLCLLTYEGKRGDKVGRRCILDLGHDLRAFGVVLMALHLAPVAETSHELGISQTALQYLIGI